MFAGLHGAYRTGRHLPCGTSSRTAFTALYGIRRTVRCLPHRSGVPPKCTAFTVRYELLHGSYCIIRCSPHCTVFTVMYSVHHTVSVCTALHGTFRFVRYKPHYSLFIVILYGVGRVHVSSTVLAELFRCLPYCTVFTAPYELLHGIYRFVRTSPYCTEFTVAYGTHRMARHLSYCTASCMEVYRTVRHSPHSAVFIVLCGIHRIARCSLSRTAFAALHDLPYGVSFDTV